ncbi:MAG: SDR family oxidoreductase [Chloroflexi bacterium]|nr:SDR family oxidoreductase [Chloroflexota bacterium]
MRPGDPGTISVRLKDRVAVVTGAGSGIGRALAVRFAQEGAHVCCADVNLATAIETADIVRSHGPSAIAVEVDVRSQAQVQAMVDQTESELGLPWVCVANAGISGRGSILDVTVEDWEAVIGVNLTGALFTMQAGARAMVRGGKGGRLIALSSVAADWAGKGSLGYATTKAAVRHMTRNIAQQVAEYGITANSLGPAAAISNMAPWMKSVEYLEQLGRTIPVRRVGRAEDVANVAAFLASDEADYVTGGYYLVDGGIGDSPEVRMLLAEAGRRGARG